MSVPADRLTSQATRHARTLPGAHRRTAPWTPDEADELNACASNDDLEAFAVRWGRTFRAVEQRRRRPRSDNVRDAWNPGRMTTDDDVLALLRDAAGSNEVYEVRTFVVYRDNEPTLRVQLQDEGPWSKNRYSTRVRREDDVDIEHGEYNGNPEPTIKDAIRQIRWNEVR